MRTLGLILCMSLFVSGATVVADDEIRVGDTRATVVEILGEPEAQVQRRGREILHYGRSTVELAHGVVIRVDPEIERQVQLQRARPHTPPSPVTPAPTTPSAEVPTVTLGQSGVATTVDKLSNGGQRVNLQQVLVPGKVTVVDFYADWCGPCRRISPMLESLAAKDPDVVLRKIDIVRWGTPVTKQFSIRSVPNIRVFDRNGKMVGKDTSRFSLVQQYVSQAK